MYIYIIHDCMYTRHELMCFKVSVHFHFKISAVPSHPCSVKRVSQLTVESLKFSITCN